jgi:hypothetical protein
MRCTIVIISFDIFKNHFSKTASAASLLFSSLAITIVSFGDQDNISFLSFSFSITNSSLRLLITLNFLLFIVLKYTYHILTRIIGTTNRNMGSKIGVSEEPASDGAIRFHPALREGPQLSTIAMVKIPHITDGKLSATIRPLAIIPPPSLGRGINITKVQKPVKHPVLSIVIPYGYNQLFEIKLFFTIQLQALAPGWPRWAQCLLSVKLQKILHDQYPMLIDQSHRLNQNRVDSIDKNWNCAPNSVLPPPRILTSSTRPRRPADLDHAPTASREL